MDEDKPNTPKERTLFFVIKELDAISLDIRNIVLGEKESIESKKEVAVSKNSVVKARNKIEKINARLSDCRRGLSLLK